MQIIYCEGFEKAGAARSHRERHSAALRSGVRSKSRCATWHSDRRWSKRRWSVRALRTSSLYNKMERDETWARSETRPRSRSRSASTGARPSDASCSRVTRHTPRGSSKWPTWQRQASWIFPFSATFEFSPTSENPGGFPNFTKSRKAPVEP